MMRAHAASSSGMADLPYLVPLGFYTDFSTRDVVHKQ